MTDQEKPLPPKDKLELAETYNKMIITIICPHCKHKWDVVDQNLEDCTKPDPVGILEPCPKCNEWMKLYDDDVEIDMFYEDHEGDEQWWEKEDD